MRSASATASSSWPEAGCAGSARCRSCGCRPPRRRDRWRTSFLRLPETFLRLPETRRTRTAPLRPLLAKELAEIVAGRALWTMLLLVCPLVGYSFFQAVSLYGEVSGSAAQSAAVTDLSPLDGILIPTFGSFYVAVTLLFPFVA